MEVQVNADGMPERGMVQKDLWSKKYEILKRKCDEFEQVRVLFRAVVPSPCGVGMRLLLVEPH